VIRLQVLLHRRPQISLSEFSEYWRDEHGPLIASHQNPLRILRYTQTHRLDEPANDGVDELRGRMEQPYDGVAEFWWESEEHALRALTSEAGTKILADEQHFTDLPRSPSWLAHEYPQFSTALTPHVARPSSAIVKAHFVLRHRVDLTRAEAQRYWLTVHGPLIRSMAASLGLLAYQQVHRFDSPVEETLRGLRGTLVDPYMGHAEMWFDRGIPRRGAEVTEAGRRAAEDEARFIDFERSGSWLGKEYVLIDRW
jgi:uncharacterized protein (TIGR02118 family)